MRRVGCRGVRYVTVLVRHPDENAAGNDLSGVVGDVKIERRSVGGHRRSDRQRERLQGQVEQVFHGSLPR